MDATRQARVAFYLTGKRPGAELEPVEGLDVRPALLARYRDLSALRYDFPVVLLSDAKADACVRSLSGIVDEALTKVARAGDGERVSKHVLRLEQAIRGAVGVKRQSLSTLWSETAEQLGSERDGQFKDSLERAFAFVDSDGELVGCDAELPGRMVAHIWQTAQTKKARRLHGEIARLVHRVSNILRADMARSEKGRSAEALQASIGGLDAEAFDFQALSGVLSRTANRTTITATRRRRLEQLIEALQSYDFKPDAFRFTTCADALAAWRERYPVLVGVARAIAMAELEIAGDYREDRHDVFFEEYGADGLSPDDIGLFADYLVCVNAAKIDAGEQAALMEILNLGLPMKILVQKDDILAESAPGSGGQGFARSAPHFAHMALGLNHVYVLQVPASHLLRCSGQIADGVAFPGTALYSVFSGATGFNGDLPAYLVAAAAAESRAFPVFAYDPAAGRDWASRFSLSGNSQPEADWPEHQLEYEDSERRRIAETVTFTFVDFAAMDERYARHLARVPSGLRDEAMIPVAKALDADTTDQPEKVPCTLMVDDQNRLQTVLVDERLLRETRRCREAWYSVQELGGIHNSHAERMLAEDRKTREAEALHQDEAAAGAEPEAAAAVSPAEAEPVAVEPEAEPSPDEAYIETARCTTCNECTQINDKMFAYNENRQAYIADIDAGTYAQLVEAAESCQVSIIHPGKPRNPDEPGLEELLSRAEPFL